MAVIKRVEQSIGHSVTLAEFPIVVGGEVELLMDLRPLRGCAGRHDQTESTGSNQPLHRVGISARIANAYAAPKVKCQLLSSPLSALPKPASNARRGLHWYRNPAPAFHSTPPSPSGWAANTSPMINIDFKGNARSIATPAVHLDNSSNPPSASDSGADPNV